MDYSLRPKILELCKLLIEINVQQCLPIRASLG